MALARARRDGGMNYWPGFVDALSTLVLGIIFLLTVFVVVQFFLSQEVSGKDTALQRLSALITSLTDQLAMEKSGRVSPPLRAEARAADPNGQRPAVRVSKVGVVAGRAGDVLGPRKDGIPEKQSAQSDLPGR